MLLTASPMAFFPAGHHSPLPHPLQLCHSLTPSQATSPRRHKPSGRFPLRPFLSTHVWTARQVSGLALGTSAGRRRNLNLTTPNHNLNMKHFTSVVESTAYRTGNQAPAAHPFPTSFCNYFLASFFSFGFELLLHSTRQAAPPAGSLTLVL